MRRPCSAGPPPSTGLNTPLGPGSCSPPGIQELLAGAAAQLAARRSNALLLAAPASGSAGAVGRCGQQRFEQHFAPEQGLAKHLPGHVSSEHHLWAPRLVAAVL